MAQTKWTDLRPKLAAAAEQRVQREKDEISLEMNLRELLEHISDLAQTDIGELLKVSKAALSRSNRDFGAQPQDRAHCVWLCSINRCLVCRLSDYFR